MTRVAAVMTQVAAVMVVLLLGELWSLATF